MCGIVAGVSKQNIVPFLVQGLQKLEYRGYDSAGIGFISDQKTNIIRKVGKVSELADACNTTQAMGTIGIGHTRWATHGKVTETNAHPHQSGNIALVHNGIIENYEALKKQLINDGYTFKSQTDTEVIAHLVHQHFAKSNDLFTAILDSVKKLQGAFGMVIMNQENSNELMVARKGSPLVIGISDEGNFIASDPLALLDKTKRFVYLEEDDVAIIHQDDFQIFNLDGNKVDRKEVVLDLDVDEVSKGQYPHFMLKEIFEQNAAIFNTLNARFDGESINIDNICGKLKNSLATIRNIHIIACGTSYNAGLVAKYWLEKYAKVAVSVEVASEYRYRDVVVLDNTLFISISQSGETADTLAALRKAKTLNYQTTLAICNVATSSLVRESDEVILTQAGVEIGVASTKAFTTQLTALLLLTTSIGILNKKLENADLQSIITALNSLVVDVKKSFNTHNQIKEIAKLFVDKTSSIFIGRGELSAIATESALKLKEISYIHAESFAAGELKHGPLALIDDEIPVVAIAPSGDIFDKMLSNIEEVKARGSKLLVVTDRSGFEKLADYSLMLDKLNPITAPIVCAIVLQLLAYEVALARGCDVDKPRNLAKSVTVE